MKQRNEPQGTQHALASLSLLMLGCLPAALAGCGAETAANGASVAGADAGVGDAGQARGTDAGEAGDASGTQDGGAAGDAAAGADTASADANTACHKDARRCDESSVYAYQQCDANGVWQTTVCPSTASVCSGGECKMPVCAPSKPFCDGSQVKQCAANGQSSVDGQDCAITGKQCIDGACSDLACKPNALTCDGVKLATCSADGTKLTVTDCPLGRICDGGACLTTVCFDGEKSCSDDGKALACNPKGTKFIVTEDCKANAKDCNDGVCGTKICTPKAGKCDGDKAMVCSDDGIKWTEVSDCKADSGICVGGGCQPLICTKGEKTCDGTQVLTCNTQGTAWTPTVCAVGEVCNEATCVTPMCKLPSVWSQHSQTFSTWSIATKNSDACDLDGDGKIDNEFGNKITAFASVLNDGLQAAVANGVSVLLLEAPGYKTDGSKFDIHVLLGTVDTGGLACSPANSNQTCNFKISSKDYAAGAQVKGDCPPAATLKDATITNGKLLAKGPTKGPFLVQLRISADAPLPLKFHKLQVHGNTSDATAWKGTSSARLCGALKKNELVQALNSLPDSFYSGLPIGKSAVLGLLKSLLQEDIDTDGDNIKDAVSAAFAFSTSKAKIIGF